MNVGTVMKYLEGADKIFLEVQSGPLIGNYTIYFRGNNSFLYFTNPFDRNDISLNFLKRTKIKIDFGSKTAGGMFFSFTSEIHSYMRDDDKISIVLPEKIDKINRRRFIRSQIKGNMKFLTKTRCMKKGLSVKVDNCEIRNISGGGVFVKTRGPLYKNDMIYSSMELCGSMIRANSVIVRGGKFEDGHYYYGLLFREIKETERDRIVNYCLNEQRKEILKEKYGLKEA
ncbi:MAG: PilZ domain-containing protein [Candidatus Muiribacteriaceae bacterium]